MENDIQSALTYQEGMERIDSDIQVRVLDQRARYTPAEVEEQAVLAALDAFESPNHRDLDAVGFGALLSQAARPYLERMAALARRETREHFGNSVSIFTPLYLANYCQSRCVYCGFSANNRISRVILDDAEIEAELRAIAATGLQEVLLLTGESYTRSSVAYIANACALARRYFRNIGVEVYPMNTADYRLLHESGADFVTVFQETYDIERYSQLHPAGHKRVFPYRFDAQERALLGGMRGIAFGALLGIADFRRDAFAVGLHAWLIQRKYPHAEVSLSCPRLRPAAGNEGFQAETLGERELLQVICAYRLFLPFATITLSTRERPVFRDNAVGIAVTKVSAGVDVGIGRHSGEADGSGQFEINDSRSVEEVRAMLHGRGLQPVMNDYIFTGENSA
jgi:2-iminoacetate synthase